MSNEPARKTNAEALQGLVEELGYVSEDDMLEELEPFDSCVPGICMNIGCRFVADYEPDQDTGFCEHCQTKSVRSLMFLLGII